MCSHSVHVIYTGLVPEQTGCLFSGLLTAETSLSFRLIFFCVPASHSLLLSVLTDWLSDLSIPKVRLLAIDKWSHNALLAASSPSALYSCISSSLSALFNLSLTSFHPPHHPVPPPLSDVFAGLSIYSFFPFCPVCCCYRSSMQQIDAEDNGSWACGELANVAQVHTLCPHVTW